MSHLWSQPEEDVGRNAKVEPFIKFKGSYIHCAFLTFVVYRISRNYNHLLTEELYI